MAVTLHSGIFENLMFVVSKKENPAIAKTILEHGGKVQKTLSKKTDYFVQGYNTEDDDRLKEAGNKSIRVIAPEYINACVGSGKLLNIHTQALGEIKSEDIFPDFMQGPDIRACFRPPGEQCREVEELPQSFGEFLLTEKYIPDAERYIVYLVPFYQKESRAKHSRKRTARGESKEYPDKTIEVLETLKEFMCLFFCLPVKILPALTIQIGKKDSTLEAGKFNYKITTYTTSASARLDAMEIIASLEELRPKDGFCILGVTDVDICENPDDPEPLLGRATGDQAGVLSTWFKRDATTTMETRIKLRALLNTAAHETLHMFGLDHCAYYACVMNSWSEPTLEPASHPDRVSPLHLCPVDLRKLQHSLRFDIAARYANLNRFYREHDIAEEAEWIASFLRLMESKTKL